MRVAAIAAMAFTETIRDRILYSLLVFAVGMIASAALLTTLAVGGEAKILKDLGLAAIALVGLLIAVFLGVALVSREIERRTIYPVMSRPVHRAEFVLGKFLGLALTLLVNVAAMGAVLLGLARLMEGRWPVELVPAVGLTFAELLLVTAAAILFSTFTTPTLSAIFTLSLFVIGHLLEDLAHFAAIAGGPAAGMLAGVVASILPNLARFRIGEAAVHGLPLAAGYVGLAILYAVAYLILLLAGAAVIFGRRDLK